MSGVVGRLCEELGFAKWGVCTLEPSKWERELRAWLEAGKHGSMAYLARNTAQRLDPTRGLEGARSAIIVADRYEGGADAPIEPGQGRIARYARGRDYHKTIKKRLHQLSDELAGQHPDARFRAFTDTAPFLERELAARAGIGWVGKHTLIIDPQLGSWLLLGGVLTTLEIEPPREQRIINDHCGTCTRCIDACPTNAITAYSVDASRCISQLTIERREPIPDEFHSAIGEWVFGCDICQEVCPHNRARNEPGPPVHEAYKPARGPGFDLLGVLGWGEGDRRQAFQGSALKRATLAMMKRNALIAAGNALTLRELPALRARIEEIARDEVEDDMVRETAIEVLDRVRQDPQH